MSFCPSTNSAVILVSPSKSCKPFNCIQFVPLYPSKRPICELNLICPGVAVGLCAVLPTGNITAPVPLISTVPFAGVRVIVLADVIPLSLMLKSSIIILPVPTALSSKSLFVTVVVI